MSQTDSASAGRCLNPISHFPSWLALLRHHLYLLLLPWATLQSNTPEVIEGLVGARRVRHATVYHWTRHPHELPVDVPVLEEHVEGNLPETRVGVLRTRTDDAGPLEAVVQGVREERRLLRIALVDQGRVERQVALKHPESIVTAGEEERGSETIHVLGGDIGERLDHLPLVHDLAFPTGRV